MTAADRLQHLVDHHEIDQVVLRYFTAVDRRDFATVRSCFSSGATGDYGALLPGLAASTPIGDVIDLIASAMGKYAMTVHRKENHDVVLSGDRATSECWATATHAYVEADRDGGRLPLIGLRYVSDLERVDGTWLITHRRAFADWRGWIESRGDRYATSADVS